MVLWRRRVRWQNCRKVIELSETEIVGPLGDSMVGLPAVEIASRSHEVVEKESSYPMYPIDNCKRFAFGTDQNNP